MHVYRPNLAAVASKVIDGEAIIMNLVTGAYYSMAGVGGTIWDGIEASQSRDAIVRRVRARYDVDEARARADLDCLLHELLAEELIVADQPPIGHAEAVGQGAAAQAAASTGTGSYSPPALNKYTDMADLLALDPPMPAVGELPVVIIRAD